MAFCLEKIIRVITVEDNQDGNIDSDTFILHNVPDDSPTPILRAVVNRKLYHVNDLKKYTGILEFKVVKELCAAAKMFSDNNAEHLPMLVFKADNAIYEATYRLHSNIVICNEATKELANKLGKEVLTVPNIVMEDNVLLLIASTGSTFPASFPAILLKNESNNKYLLDIINPDLIKVVSIEE